MEGHSTDEHHVDTNRSHESYEDSKAGITSSSNDGNTKTPPNLRKGKWTVEEEKYANKIIYMFNKGILQIPLGTTLRSYLSEKLNCDPMRITKKFAGPSCIGKQIFQPASWLTLLDKAMAGSGTSKGDRDRDPGMGSLTPEELRADELELERLERAFRQRQGHLQGIGQTSSSSHRGSPPVPSCSDIGPSSSNTPAVSFASGYNPNAGDTGSGWSTLLSSSSSSSGMKYNPFFPPDGTGFGQIEERIRPSQGRSRGRLMSFDTHASGSPDVSLTSIPGFDPAPQSCLLGPPSHSYKYSYNPGNSYDYSTGTQPYGGLEDQVMSGVIARESGDPDTSDNSSGNLGHGRDLHPISSSLLHAAGNGSDSDLSEENRDRELRLGVVVSVGVSHSRLSALGGSPQALTRFSLDSKPMRRATSAPELSAMSERIAATKALASLGMHGSSAKEHRRRPWQRVEIVDANSIGASSANTDSGAIANTVSPSDHLVNTGGTMISGFGVGLSRKRCQSVMNLTEMGGASDRDAGDLLLNFFNTLSGSGEGPGQATDSPNKRRLVPNTPSVGDGAGSQTITVLQSPLAKRLVT